MRAGPTGSARILFQGTLAVAALALTPLTLAQPAAAQVEAGQLAGRDNAAIDDFYRARGGRTLWFTSIGRGKPRRTAYRLDRSGRFGRTRSARLSIPIVDRATRAAWSGSPRAVAKADLLLSRAFVAYVRDLRSSGSSGTIFIDRDSSRQSRRRARYSRRRPPLPRLTPTSPIWAGCIRSTVRSVAHSPMQGGISRAAELAQIGPHQPGARARLAGRFRAALHHRRCRRGATLHV